jgi:hypothetical protein
MEEKKICFVETVILTYFRLELNVDSGNSRERRKKKYEFLE